jgi:hypothetical protein
MPEYSCLAGRATRIPGVSSQKDQQEPNAMRIITTIALASFAVTPASAATLDFRTSPYASTFGPNVTTDTVDGVAFTITATARGVNGFRQGSAGLNFGVPGNGMYSVSIVSDTDLEYTALTGRGHTLTSFAGQLPFDLSADGELQVDDLMFGPGTFSSADLGEVFVAAGDPFLIAVDFGALTGSSIYASAVLQTLDFEQAAPVPVPGAALLFGSALVGAGVFGRRKKHA